MSLCVCVTLCSDLIGGHTWPGHNQLAFFEGNQFNQLQPVDQNHQMGDPDKQEPSCLHHQPVMKVLGSSLNGRLKISEQ